MTNDLEAIFNFETEGVAPETITAEPQIDETQEELDNPLEDNSPEDVDKEEEGSSDPYFEYLVENKLIEVDEDFQYDGTEEGLAKAIERSNELRQEKAKMEILSALPDDFKPLLEYGLSGGNSLQEYLATFAPNDIDSLDLEDEGDQETIIATYYKEQSNMSDEKIQKLIQRLKASESLGEEALEAKQYLTEYREAKKLEFVAAQAKAQEEYNERIKQEAKKFNDSFNSYQTTQTRKAQIQGLFQAAPSQKNKYTTLLDSIQSNYSHLLQFADLLLDYDPDKGFNIERFQKQATTNKTKSLKDALDNRIRETRPKLKGSLSDKEANDFDFEKFLKHSNN